MRMMYTGTLFVLLLCTTVTLVRAKRGIIVTAPETWMLQSEETICVSFHDIDFDVASETKVKLQYGEDDTETYTESVTFKQGTDGCFAVMLTRGGNPYNARLMFKASGRAADGSPYRFKQNTSISVQGTQATANITFIETDKPMYKPGDKVQLRILTIQNELKPRLEMLPLVVIENPLGIRIMQWRDVSVTELQGLANFSFDLSSEPTLGDWKITVLREDGQKHSQTFPVQEYVLPKFEVTITAPAFIAVWVDTIETEICAKYTYGQPVKGNLTISSCMKLRYGHGAPPCIEDTIQIDGCHTVTFPLSAMLSQITTYRDRGAYVTITATVTEEGTDITIQSSMETKPLSFQHYSMEFVDTPLFFKPGINFTGQVKVTDESGGSVDGLEVDITVENTKQSLTEQHHLTDTNGLLMFQLPNLELAEESDYISLRAKFLSTHDYGNYTAEIRNPTAMMSIRVWHSPSNSYMKIHKLPETVNCGQEIEVDVTLEGQHNQQQIFYEITVQNRIVLLSNTKNSAGAQIEENHLKLTVVLPEKAWGLASLLVYTVAEDGEVIADSTKFTIKHCANNKVSLEFSEVEVAPGDEVSLEMSASPGSLCAYGIMDKSMQLLGGKTSVTMDFIMNKVQTKNLLGGSYRNHDEVYCEQKENEEEEEDDEDEKDDIPSPRPRPIGRPRKNKGRRNRNRDRNNRRRPRSIYYPGVWYSRFVDANKAFQMSELMVLTDLTINTRPCAKRRIFPVYDTMMPGRPPGMPGQLPEMPGLVMSLQPMQSMDLNEDFVENPTSSKENVVDSVRSYFPETWLWDILPIGTEGRGEVVHRAPDTITEWSGHAVCTSITHGLGISNDATLRTFQPFFVSLSLPYSVIRGETLLLPVSVFNYLSQCLVISLEILPSEEYRVEAGGRQEVCVCGQEKITHQLPITAQSLGHVNITVRAESVDNAVVCGNVIMSSQIGVRDTVIRELLVEAEGKEEEYAFSSFMCPSDDGSSVEHHQWTVPADIVVDSLRIHASVMGDVMGPALSGLDSLLRLPTGCGEQNMLKFAPNIYILQYLKNAHELNEAIEKKALDYMRTGYQRELTYRHSDGSYSAFGSSDDSGSTWLTAFVLKSFSQAAEFIDIDDSELKIIRLWFMESQLENGCFRKVGRILHKSMKGGLASDQDSLAPLTAYSLVALLEAGFDPHSDFIENALSCLASQEYTDVYSVALVSYAYSLLGKDSFLAQNALDHLDQFKTTEDSLAFWSIPSSDITTTNSYHKVTPADVEITAYALMAHLNMAADPISDIDTTLPIVRWLTAQRNPNGGFLSTQDTVVALQALAKFAEIMKSDSSDVSVNIKVKDEDHDFTVNLENHLLLQKKKMNTELEPGEVVDVNLRATGSGCSFVQASMRYNVLNVTRGSTHSINLDVFTSRTEDNTCYRRVLKVCMRYEGPDEATNMALLDVKMVTGWSPVESTVQKLLQEVTIPLSRYEVDKKNVNFYFTELTRGQDVCLEFTVNQDIEVRNPKPATVTVYDYYDQQDVFYQSEYNLRSICGTKEELPFGEIPLVDGQISQVRQPIPEFPGLGGDDDDDVRPEQIPCPLCHGEAPDVEQLKPVLCQASHVYRGIVKNPGVLKVHKDLVQKNKINKMTSVTLAEHCSCPLLDSKKQWVWIISPSSEITSVGRRRGTLELTAGDQVIPVQKKSKVLDRLLKKMKRSRQCQEPEMP